MCCGSAAVRPMNSLVCGGRAAVRSGCRTLVRRAAPTVDARLTPTTRLSVFGGLEVAVISGLDRFADEAQCRGSSVGLPTMPLVEASRPNVPSEHSQPRLRPISGRERVDHGGHQRVATPEPQRSGCT